MNIISLFDGLGCAMIALKELGITVDKYYASEIDKYAVMQTKHNFPGIEHLGTVTDWRTWEVTGQIDMLFGGFP